MEVSERRQQAREADAANWVGTYPQDQLELSQTQASTLFPILYQIDF
jgi:hypothetical protein